MDDVYDCRLILKNADQKLKHHQKAARVFQLLALHKDCLPANKARYDVIGQHNTDCKWNPEHVWYQNPTDPSDSALRQNLFADITLNASTQLRTISRTFSTRDTIQIKRTNKTWRHNKQNRKIIDYIYWSVIKDTHGYNESSGVITRWCQLWRVTRSLLQPWFL